MVTAFVSADLATEDCVGMDSLYMVGERKFSGKSLVTDCANVIRHTDQLNEGGAVNSVQIYPKHNSNHRLSANIFY